MYTTLPRCRLTVLLVPVFKWVELRTSPAFAPEKKTSQSVTMRLKGNKDECRRGVAPEGAGEEEYAVSRTGSRDYLPACPPTHLSTGLECDDGTLVWAERCSVGYYVDTC